MSLNSQAPISTDRPSPVAVRYSLLAVSDLVEPHLYQPGVADRLGHVDLIISCGDLPFDYLDFLSSALNAPLYHVLGNHCQARHDDESVGCSPGAYIGATSVHARLENFKGPGGASLLIAGIEGSPLYNNGPHQYTEAGVALRLLRLVPGLLRARVQKGRYLDIFVTHTPPRGIHDLEDRAHKGHASFLPFLKSFRPMLMLHGHTHRYDPTQPTRTQYEETAIINVYGHTLLQLEYSPGERKWRLG